MATAKMDTIDEESKQGKSEAVMADGANASFVSSFHSSPRTPHRRKRRSAAACLPPSGSFCVDAFVFSARSQDAFRTSVCRVFRHSDWPARRERQIEGKGGHGTEQTKIEGEKRENIRE